jgi:anhydro-N-acetylmuramic acid kinase
LCRLYFRQVHYLTYPYPNGLKEDLLQLSREDGRIQDVCSYNVLLGRIFADAAKAVVEAAGKKMEEVFLVGSHG